jgi:putative RecB family exonuclease
MTQYTNEHLSYSRLSRFEQCPLSFKLHYIERLRAEPGLPLRFGKAVHAVLEVLVREHMEEERVGPLWQEAWAREERTGVDVFQEGVEILQRFVRDQGALDAHDVLAVEKEFRLPVGSFTELGFIDRVDRVDDETIKVIDYKTNRMLFSPAYPVLVQIAKVSMMSFIVGRSFIVASFILAR